MYYDSLNRYAVRGLVEVGRYYREFAQDRRFVQSAKNWIPYIQNHSNLFKYYIPSAHDYDDLREPTASELRAQCNIALGLGADGIMMYQFVSCPNTANADTAFWPQTKEIWDSNPSRNIDGGAGSLGFLDRDTLTHVGLVGRTCDWNGERKWDSTAAYLNSFLQPVGDTIKLNLDWQEAQLWSIHGMDGAGTNSTVSGVLSMRQDLPNPLDDSDSTFVLVSEFEHKTTHHRYLFVANTRTHPIEGHRHITVKLAPSAGEFAQWRVTNVMTNDIWIVEGSDDPDDYTRANGFTDYYAPGAAALFRLEPMADWNLEFDGVCLQGSMYIEPEAILISEYDQLRFDTGKGIVCEGYYRASHSTFECCDTEQRWCGIQARDEGTIEVNNCALDNTTVGVSVGSLAYGELYQTTFTNSTIAIANLGGYLSTSFTTAPTCDDLYLLSAGYSMSCSNDIAQKSAALAAQDIGVLGFTGVARLDHSRIEGFATGVLALMGSVNGDPINPAFNRIDAQDAVLHIPWWSVNGAIDFGDAAGAPGAMNCFILQNTLNGSHAIGLGGTIQAVENYWEPSPPIFMGSVNAADTLQTCPALFTAPRTSFSKSTAGGAPVARSRVRDAFLDSNYVLLRQALGGILASRTTVIDRGDLDLLRSHILFIPGFEDLRDTLAMHLLSVPDLKSKLLAAEVLAEGGRFREAYEVIQAWSFSGSRGLQTHALLCTALFAPLAMNGGYRIGLQAVQEISNIVGNDSTMRPLFDLYPKLFGGLRIARSDSTTPKTHATTSILERIIPRNVEMGQNYPNPFSSVTSFTFKLPDTREVKLSVHDMLGREVAVVKQGMLDRGVHSAVLHAGRLSAGMYLYRLQAGTEVVQGRMVLLR